MIFLIFTAINFGSFPDRFSLPSTPCYTHEKNVASWVKTRENSLLEKTTAIWKSFVPQSVHEFPPNCSHRRRCCCYEIHVFKQKSSHQMRCFILKLINQVEIILWIFPLPSSKIEKNEVERNCRKSRFVMTAGDERRNLQFTLKFAPLFPRKLIWTASISFKLVNQKMQFCR